MLVLQSDPSVLLHLQRDHRNLDMPSPSCECGLYNVLWVCISFLPQNDNLQMSEQNTVKAQVTDMQAANRLISHANNVVPTHITKWNAQNPSQSVYLQYLVQHQLWIARQIPNIVESLFWKVECLDVLVYSEVIVWGKKILLAGHLPGVSYVNTCMVMDGDIPTTGCTTQPESFQMTLLLLCQDIRGHPVTMAFPS